MFTFPESPHTTMLSKSATNYLLFMCMGVIVTVIGRSLLINDESSSSPNTIINVDSLIRRGARSMSAVDVSMVNVSDDTNGIDDFLQDRYGPVKFTGIRSVDTNLTPDEQQRYAVCVKYATRDRANNGSRFWPVQQIRRTHHTYLKKKDAIMIEAGGMYVVLYHVMSPPTL